MPRTYSLPKSSILRGRKNFEAIFLHSTQYVHHGRLLAKFEVFNREKDIETLNFLAAFLTPKRIGKAAKRNRTRRKMKEMFRKARPSFIAEISAVLPALEVQCAFIAKTQDYLYEDMQRDFDKILTKLSHQLVKKYGNKPTDTP